MGLRKLHSIIAIPIKDCLIVLHNPFRFQPPVYSQYTQRQVTSVAGLIIVPTAFIYGEEIISGSGLLFQVPPSIFMSMPNGNIVGTLFFLLVSIAAVTSILSIFEVPMSTLNESFSFDRIKAALVTMLIVLAIGLPACLGYGPFSFIEYNGKHILEMMDMVTNTILMPIMGVITCLFVAYVLKFTPIIEEIKLSSPFKLEKVYVPVIKYVAPIMICAIMFSGILSFIGMSSI